MVLSEILEKAVKELQHRNISFAVGGSLVASVYRLEKRAIMSIQLLVDSNPSGVSFLQKLFQHELFEMSLPDSNLARDLKPLNSISAAKKVIFLQISKDPKFGLEIVFPNYPWIPDAIERAEYNKLDFGFGMIPTLTVEDIIIAKLFSTTCDLERYLDLDDLQNIFKAKHDLDLSYLASQINKFSLSFHKSLWEDAPKGLRRIGRKTGAASHISSSF